MRATLLGFTVPDELLEQINAGDRLMQTQTHRFAWSLVRALRQNGVEIDLLSAAPVSDYPGNPRVLWRSGSFSAHGTPGRFLPFVNLMVLKHVTRYLGCWLSGMPELRRTRPDWIVVHGVHSPFLWFATQAAKRVGARVAVVLTDPPGVIRQEDGRLRSALKATDIGVVTKALRRSDAVIVLAPQLAEDFAPGVPAIVAEGLTDLESNAQLPPRNPARPRRVVFAGGLHEEYGVARLVEAFRLLPGELELHLFGRGPLEPWLVEQAGADPRIQAPRLVSPQDLPEIYAQASVLVQPRQVDQDFVRYSFPSKLIEYLASGTPVVSTRLPTIPADYEPFVAWAAGDAPTDLAAAIDRVLTWGDTDAASFGAAGSTFIRTTRGSRPQGARIVEFLGRVRGG